MDTKSCLFFYINFGDCIVHLTPQNDPKQSFLGVEKPFCNLSLVPFAFGTNKKNGRDVERRRNLRLYFHRNMAFRCKTMQKRPEDPQKNHQIKDIPTISIWILVIFNGLESSIFKLMDCFKFKGELFCLHLRGSRLLFAAFFLSLFVFPLLSFLFFVFNYYQKR